MSDITHEMPDLLPCPFCGGEAKYYHRSDDSGWGNTDWVSCAGGCGASTCMHETKEEAIAAWNTRNDDLVQAAVAAALREELEAKLAKAVEAFKKLRRRQDCLETFDAVVDEITETALAELTGQDDD